MAKSLNDFIKDNQRFLKLEDGDSVTGLFLGSRVIANKYDTDGTRPETVEYALEIDGRKLTWTNGQVDVAQNMARLKNGDKLRITRAGSGNKTKYLIASPAIKKQAPALGVEDDSASESVESGADEEVPF